MLAGIRRSLHSLNICVEAAGSSTAQRTMEMLLVSSRSEARKLRSMCVICLRCMRYATSGLRPEDGHMTVT